MKLNSRYVNPEHTAVRVALWRALHMQVDSKPHVMTDEVGLKLVDEKSWRDRPDMNPEFSKSMRASIVARARFTEDLVLEQVKLGVDQYVILGAGLDTFAQRQPELGSSLQIYEIDQPGPQAWKQKRLKEIGLPIPKSLHFVPVNFELEESWWEKLVASGFNPQKPAVFVSTGVSLYLSKQTNIETLQCVAQNAKGSTFAMTFLLTLELMDSQERSSMEFVMKKALESGTPFKSLFVPSELINLAMAAGFQQAHYVAFEELAQRYFADRTDGLCPPNAEGFLIART